MKLRAIFCSALLALLAACGGGGGDDSAGPAPSPTRPVASQPASCAVADQRDWLRAYMADRYLWPQQIAAADPLAADMDAYFRSMLNLPLDRYSYSQSAADFNQFFQEGTRTGYGYALTWADAEQTRLLVRSVEPASPVGRAGLQRGEQVLEIDGYAPSQIVAGALPRVSTEGVPRSFVVAGAGGVRRFTVASANFALGTVEAAQVIDWPGADGSTRPVAYLAYHEFILSSETALDAAFSRFVAAGARELVLDLRYNGGGSVVLARALASMAGGSRVDGHTFAGLRFNAGHTASNYDMPFITLPGLLPGPVLPGLERVFVITSPSTASASELVINGLKPFMPVVQVGGTTYGKPYGFVPREACGRVYSAVAFESVNDAGAGGFVQGIPATCQVEDDLSHALGDPQEARLAAALYYVSHGSCPARSLPPATAPMLAAPASKGSAFGEVPRPQMWLQ